MNKNKKVIGGKSPRLRLDPMSYRGLQRQVLERDGWRCQTCGSMQRLQVHHLRFRSQSGSDVEQNLITLCSNCHARIHQRPGDWNFHWRLPP
jgi:5-methylcytosine-specific restriction endonuclease McrA